MAQIQTHRESPTSLLRAMGITPADNREGFKTAHHWRSKIVGEQVRNIFRYAHCLRFVGSHPFLYGPVSLAAQWQSCIMDALITSPIKSHARAAARTGRNPDIFGELDGRIYKAYASLLQELCGLFMKEGRFDRDKARRVSSTLQGRQILRNYIEEFARLEYRYNSLGLSRLQAMKDLLKCLLVVITESPLDGEELPYIMKRAGGSAAVKFEKYLERSRLRLETLYQEDAFDIEKFSEKVTACRIGYSYFEYVGGSEINNVRLRHYPLPHGIQPNRKVLYAATPLINKPEIFDLAPGKSVIEGMLKEGYGIYLVDHGEPGPEESRLGLDFYGKRIHDCYLDMIQRRHPGAEIDVMAYCMAGTLLMPYLARRAEERFARGQEMDIKKVALMASPVRFDDGKSGHGPMREVIRRYYDPLVMEELFGTANIPPEVIEFGMHEIQPGVEFTVAEGFFGRDVDPDAIKDSAPFLYWLTHGTKFPTRAHREWIENIFIGNQICEGKYRLPSSIPSLDGKAVNMDILREAGVTIFNYRGRRDPIAPPGSCVASELWGQVQKGNIEITRGWLNRTIEKNVGHIFVVSKQLLGEYLAIVSTFFRDQIR